MDSDQLRAISGIRQGDGTSRRAQQVSWFRTPNFQQIDDLVTAIVEQVCNIGQYHVSGIYFHVLFLNLIFREQFIDQIFQM